MKILITTDCYTPMINGVVTSIQTLEAHLRSLGHEVKILCPSQYLHGESQNDVVRIGSTNLHFVGRSVRQAVLHPPKNLQFAGYAPKEQLQEAYSGCDLFLFPSYEETEGIVVLEALAMQIPVLLRRIPIYTEWLRESQDMYFAGDLLEFKKMAVQILQEKLPDLTENGYLAVQKKDLSYVGKQLLRVYQSCRK